MFAFQRKPRVLATLASDNFDNSEFSGMGLKRHDGVNSKHGVGKNKIES